MTCIDEYIEFLQKSTTPHHVAQNSLEILRNNEFIEIARMQDISQEPGKYFIIFQETLVIAFVIPELSTERCSLKMIATHSDSPVLKIKPNALINSPDFVSLQPYGGGLWHTWFDRPLGVAGKVIFEDLSSSLVSCDKPIFYIPSLPIHLSSNDVYREGFKYNKEQHLKAIYASEYNISYLVSFLQQHCASNLKISDEKTQKSKIEFEKKKKNLTESIINSQDSNLNIENYPFEHDVTEKSKILSENSPNSSSKDLKERVDRSTLENKYKEILAFDLSLFDTRGPVKGGIDNKFIFSARQDNLLSTFCALQSLISSSKSNSINVVAIFDHEEIGSETVAGAQTQLILDFIGAFQKKIDKESSLIISADVSHGFNPNYSEKYDNNHKIILGKGIAIKHSSSYCTNHRTAAIIKYLLKNKNYQEFCLKNDMYGGSTIGPMLCARTGIPGADIGAPVLGMHSICEVSHIDDILTNIVLFSNFFENNFK